VQGDALLQLILTQDDGFMLGLCQPKSDLGLASSTAGAGNSVWGRVWGGRQGPALSADAWI